MGIDKLNQILREHCESAFTTINANKFSGHAIAIDANLWLFGCKSVVYRKLLDGCPNPLAVDAISNDEINLMISVRLSSFFRMLLSQKIVPVWITDGTSRDEKVEYEKERRSAASARSRQRYVECVEALSSLDPLVRDYGELKKIMAQLVFIDRSNIDTSVETCKQMGIPFFQAKHDAEFLCSTLYNEKKVIAVWTSDTDVYVLGVGVVINGYRYVNDEIVFDCVLPQMLIDNLEITREQFVDYCILLGCDFNGHIKGLGPVKALQMIKKYGSIDRFPADVDVTPLNHRRCREIFGDKTHSGIPLESLRVVSAFGDDLVANHVS